MASSNLKRGKKKIVILPVHLEKKEIQAKKALTIKKKQEDSIVLFTSQVTSSKDHDLNIGHHDILPNLPPPYIQIPIDEINKLDDLAVNIKKDNPSKEIWKRELRYNMCVKFQEFKSSDWQEHLKFLVDCIKERPVDTIIYEYSNYLNCNKGFDTINLFHLMAKHTAIYNERIKPKKSEASEAFDDSQTK
ncbi:17977_t:CDS:2, partial [Funneliformis geosporum]